MGFFDRFKKKASDTPSGPVVLAAVAKGAVVKMPDIPDEVFAQGILGQCCGIDPEIGEVYAPCDGEITQAPDTLHALGLAGDGGVEVLLHVGVDTVEMKGDGFVYHIREGQRVHTGDPLITFAPEKIKAAGHPIITAFVVSDPGDTSPTFTTGMEAKAGETAVMQF